MIRQPVALTSALRPMQKLLEIIFEDDGLLVINKPADLVCHPTKSDAFSSLISRVRLYLGENGPPHLVNRLDRETSGVIIVAKNDAAARELRRSWETGAVNKQYRAIVHGHPRVDQALIDAPLGRDEQSCVAIKNCVRPDGAPSRTEFRVERRFVRVEGEFTVLRVRPHSGRKHQIRIHLAHFGHPVVGDKLYGGDERLYLDFVTSRLTPEQRLRLLLPCHALHASELGFCWLGEHRTFRAEAEGWFRDFELGQFRERVVEEQ